MGWGSKSLLALLAVATFETSAWAASPLARGVSFEPNASYLVSTQNDMSKVRSDSFMGEDVADLLEIDSARSTQLRREFETVLRQHEDRRNYGLTNSTDEQKYMDWNREFAQNSVVKTLREQRVKENLRSIRKAAERDENLMVFKKPIVVAAAVVGLYTGSEFTVVKSDQTKVVAQSQLQSKKAGVQVASSVVNGEISYNDESEQRKKDIAAGKIVENKSYDYANVSLTRNVPVLQVATAVSYGLGTGTLVTSVSRALTDSLSCTVSRATSVSQTENIVRMGYGLKF